MHIGMRKALLGAGVATLAMALSTQAFAQQRRFDIPAQDAATAVTAFGLQADVQISAPTGQLRGVKTPAVQGEMDARAALQMLLAGTGLVVARDDGRTIVLQMAPQGGSADGGADINAVEELIVTAQKKEEAIQDVPIAISAFTQKSLDAQKLEGGFDLLKAIPNVTFSKTNFTGYNFSIRGIGTKAIAASTDPAVAVSFNNVALIHNRLFEQEYFDVERVEVLRGPQGTLYGRNATSGVINVISAKPRLGEFEADVKAEGGNYNARRLKGMINVPVGDTLAVRLAGAWTKRDGYGTNLSDGSDVDDRDLWSVRTSVAFEPHERLRANLIWERFQEDDGRVRTSKQLCHRDPGDQFVGGFDMMTRPNGERFMGTSLSQGCLPGSLYDEAAFGTPNGMSFPFVAGARVVGAVGFAPDPTVCNVTNAQGLLGLLNACNFDPYGGLEQSRDLRTIESQIPPVYKAKADVFEFNLDFDVTDSLTFSSQTAYVRDEVFSTQDFNRYHSLPLFNDSHAACQAAVTSSNPCVPTTATSHHNYDLTPGGIYTDPQLGPSDTLVAMDRSTADATQFTQEFRLQSNFDGPLNFSAGANYTYFSTVNDYYVFINVISMLAEGWFNSSFIHCNGNFSSKSCIYVDPNPIGQINGEGHNYFRSQNPYKLNSTAVFGELYWQATDTVKVTAGLRWTADRKVFTPHPSQTLLIDYCESPAHPGPGCTIPQFSLGGAFGTGLSGTASRGYPAEPDIVQNWAEPTGRLVVDWKPDLGFTDETMVYASYAHGYKGGGANPPGISLPSGGLPNNLAAAGVADAPRTFEPEFIDAFEIGAKNTLLDGRMTFNATAFYYDYKNYQVSKIVNRSAANENFDAEVWGAEIEWTYAPTRNLRFNGTFGHLDTKIADGERSIDLMDRVQGGHHSSWIDADGVEHALAYDDWTVLKPSLLFPSNCVAPTELVKIAAQYSAAYGFGAIFCPGGDLQFGSNFFSAFTPSGFVSIIPDIASYPNAGAGFFAELGGNELPNAPHWTTSLGAQYSFALSGGWDATLRGDVYWQSQSFHRVYNTQYDKLRGWSNANLSLWVENPELGVKAEVYVKNLADDTPITDAFLNSDDTLLTTNVFVMDPRLIGVSIRKSF